MVFINVWELEFKLEGVINVVLVVNGEEGEDEE